MIDVLVPDIPKRLENKMKRERYLARQLLQDPHIQDRLSSCV